MIPKAALCGCLTDVSGTGLAALLRHPEVDLLEWRLDLFLQHHSLAQTREALSRLAVSRRHPVVATNRPTREGGAFAGPENLRLEILHQAVEAGAEWVDLEAWVDDSTVQGFRGQDTRILISHHDFAATPERLTLQHLAEAAARCRPDAVKIVAYAQTPEDNLRVLDLIPFGRDRLGVEVLAFCMGPLGRWSRLICLLLGSPWTYVQLPELGPAAPGQWTAAEMRRMLKVLGAGCWVMSDE